jgi:peptide/nickel transport system substrate-binding protein
MEGKIYYMFIYPNYNNRREEEKLKKKIIWLVVSCLMVLSLVISACGPKAAEEATVTEEGGQVVTTKGEENEEAVTEEGEALLPPDVPKYGGTVIRQIVGSALLFNPLESNRVNCGTCYVTQETLISGDWSKGPSGTNENDYFDGFGGQFKFLKGWLAESWELPDSQTIIYHIRHGVRWWNKPPVNGREVTAEDVAWTLNKYFTTTSTYVYLNFALAGMTPTSIKALDKYTVEVKLPPDCLGMFLVGTGDTAWIYPANITDQVDLSEWENAISTGAWMLTDYVPAVSQTYTKNPDYWQFDPNHPKNQLPYPDKMILLEISDQSTLLAAFRTGRMDMIRANSDDWQQLMKEHPELQYSRMQSSGIQLSGRLDKDLPFNDIRVRQALCMAINRQELIDTYYNGEAVLLGYPIKVHKAWAAMYTPLDELPESVQELFTYNPEKARQLLAEAGYPNGFKTTVACDSAPTTADFLSIIREYLLAIGVDMEIEVQGGGTWFSVWTGRTQKEMIYATMKPEHPYLFYCERKDQFWDSSFWSDPRIDQAFLEAKKYLGVDDAEIVRIMKEATPIILESAWGCWLPIPYSFFIWWPWFQGYHGEFDIGFNAQGHELTYIWIDEALKKSMGY